MDLRVTPLDARYTGVLYNFDGEPPQAVIKDHLLDYVRKHWDRPESDGHDEVVLEDFDGARGGVATVRIGREAVRLSLTVDPKISQGASVAVSSTTHPKQGLYGVVTGADPSLGLYTVEMLDGSTSQYMRNQLADLTEYTTIDDHPAAHGQFAPEQPPMFPIGEIAERTCADGTPVAVRITRRCYTRRLGNVAGAWHYFALGVDGGGPGSYIHEDELRYLPRNLQNLRISPRSEWL